MRLIQVLYKQHIGWHFKKHWQSQGKRVLIENKKTEKRLTDKGKILIEANEYVAPPKKERVELNITGLYKKPLPQDKNHPEYKQRFCHVFNANSVLLEGSHQAQVLTKSVATDDLPEKIKQFVEETEIPDVIHDQVKKTIMSANVYDCEQLKLPKIKDEARPAYNFPRILGITDQRRNVITTNKLLGIVERFASLDVTLKKRLTRDVDSSVTFEKNNDLIQLNQRTDMLISSLSALSPVSKSEITKDEKIIDIYPIKHTVTLEKLHFYNEDPKYPISLNTPRVFHPHTTVLHFNETIVLNLYDTPVLDKQICGRSLIHAFTVAAAYAKTLYGSQVVDLPEPVTVQCVHSDGRLFHFGVLQLNTLNLDGVEGVKNCWWSIPRIPLFQECQYVDAIPTLTYYNPKVFKILNAFYHSQ